MDLVVCLKQVPDTAAEIKPLADGSGLDTADLPWIINPYDEYALEEAIRIKERLGGGTVAAVTLGPERAATALRTALAMGADKAVHITGAEFEGSDAAVTAKVLARAVSRSPFDLVLCGKIAVDNYDAQVGILLAQHLGIPHLSCIVKLEVSADQKSITAHCETDRGTEVVQCDLPALVTAEKGLNAPRYPAVIAMMKAKQKPIEVLSATELGFSAQEIGVSGSRLRLLSWQSPPKRGECKTLEGEPGDAARALLRLLREEAKAI
jgi:electron transfer flavoprotein beta subunit